jgi:hypothetical protein
MNATDFASLSGTMFDTVVRAESNLRARRLALEVAEGACTCARSCKCSAAPAIAAAKLAEREAIADTVERRAAWTEYCAIRQGR